jgi:anti-sigma factor RsiW
MRCNDFLDNYSAYRDGTEPVLAAAMDDHIAACPECRAHDAAVRWGVETLRGDPMVPSPDFERTLRERLALSEVFPERGTRRVAPMVATAMAVLALALVFLAVRRPHVVATAVAEGDPPIVAKPLARAGIPFVSFVPSR